MTGPATARPALLVSTSSFPRWPDDTDPRFVEELCHELAAEFDVTVLAPRSPRSAESETLARDGRYIRVHRYGYFLRRFETLTYDGGIAAKLRGNPFRALLIPFLLVGQLRALLSIGRRQRIDVLHAHWILPQGLVAAAYRRIARRPPPLLVTVHGSDLAMLRGSVMKTLNTRILRSAERVAAVSDALRRDLIELGCDPERVVVGSMGVDLRARFTPGEVQDRRGLVCVGKLSPGKGTRFLLQALARLAGDYPGLALELVGDGTERASLEGLAADLGIAERVRFTGPLPQAAVADRLRRASIAVMPSLSEGLGLAAVEAMGCGCAVVASDLPALRDVIKPGETGLLATPGDPDDLARKIRELLDDDRRRQQIAAAGREAVLRRFDWSAVGGLYREILTGLG